MPAYQESLTLARALTAAHPEVADYATLLGSNYVGLGNVERDTGQVEAALKRYEEALQTLAPVLRKNAQDPDARKFQGQAYAGRAAALTRLGRTAEALADWDRALALASGSAQIRLRVSRALELARSGTVQAAEVDQLARSKSLSGAVLCDLARIAALSSAAAGKDSKLSEADQTRLAKQHAGRAVGLLQQAREAGYFQDAARVANLKTDSDLAPLRARADFQKLLAELEETATKPSK